MHDDEVAQYLTIEERIWFHDAREPEHFEPLRALAETRKALVQCDDTISTGVCPLGCWRGLKASHVLRYEHHPACLFAKMPRPAR